MSKLGITAAVAFALLLFSSSNLVMGAPNRTIERLIVTNLTIMSGPHDPCDGCAQPYSWSDCSNGKRSAVSYECSESTGYRCQSKVYTQVCNAPSGQYDVLIVAVIAALIIGYAGLKFREERLMRRRKGKVKKFSRQH